MLCIIIVFIIEPLLDHLYDVMERNDMKHVINMMTEERYDADAIQQDCDQHSNAYNSNILTFIHRESKQRIVKDFLFTIKLHQYTFSFGEESLKCTWEKNQKYESLKEEILNNKINNLPPYLFNLLLHKACKYIHSAKAKNLIGSQNNGGCNETLTTSHLLAMCIYCNCTDLSQEFSATFRKNKWNETVDSVQRKNTEFGHMTNLLSAMITHFGTSSKDGNIGPYFCGMSYQMVFKEFKSNIPSPLSTTKCIAVDRKSVV